MKSLRSGQAAIPVIAVICVLVGAATGRSASQARVPTLQALEIPAKVNLFPKSFGTPRVFEIANLDQRGAPHTVALTSPATFTATSTAGHVPTNVAALVGQGIIEIYDAVGVLTGDPYSGELGPVDASVFASDPQAAACAPGMHDAVWFATVQKNPSNGHAYSVPVAADLTGGQLRITVCLGALRAAGITVSNVTFFTVAYGFKPTAGSALHTWSALVTPALSASAPDPPHAYELRADELPTQKVDVASVRYRNASKKLTVAGKLTRPDGPRGKVQLVAVGVRKRDLIDPGSFTIALDGATPGNGAVDDNAIDGATYLPGGSTRTDGTFSIGGQADPVPTYVVVIVPTAVAKCTQPSTAPQGCITETVGGIVTKAFTTGRPLTLRFAATSTSASTTLRRSPKGPVVGSVQTKTFTKVALIKGVAKLRGGTIRFNGSDRPLGTDYLEVSTGTGAYDSARGTVAVIYGKHPRYVFHLVVDQ